MRRHCKSITHELITSQKRIFHLRRGWQHQKWCSLECRGIARDVQSKACLCHILCRRQKAATQLWMIWRLRKKLLNVSRASTFITLHCRFLCYFFCCWFRQIFDISRRDQNVLRLLVRPKRSKVFNNRVTATKAFCKSSNDLSSKNSLKVGHSHKCCRRLPRKFNFVL